MTETPHVHQRSDDSADIIPDKTHIRRRVYNGGDVKVGYRVTGMSVISCESEGLPRELTRVANLDEYGSGCKLHNGCFGHMSVTPSGTLLLPQSLSMKSGDVQTQHYVASGYAFMDDEKAYVDALKATNYGKRGNMRSVLSTPVAGSARLVTTPHTDVDPFCVYISANLASKTIFCTIELDDNGVPSKKFTERCIKEGDYVMLVRPPSLTVFNNQPYRVKFWNRETLGVHPTVFSHFHGDYDGDETHIYPLSFPASLEEARLWNSPVNSKFTTAAMKVNEQGIGRYNIDEEPGDVRFIRNSTLSSQQIRESSHSLYIGPETRNKTEHLAMMGKTLREPVGTSRFFNDAVKGVGDIMRQQLSQPVVGYMTRMARIAAMCVIRSPDGGTYMVNRHGTELLVKDTSPSVGSPAVRITMALCSMAQQSALDAHRVGSTESTSMDLISNMLKGRIDVPAGGECRTLCLFESEYEPVVRASLNPSWVYTNERYCVALVVDDALSTDIATHLRGAYSPLVLSAVARDRQLTVCCEGIRFVLDYYGADYEEDDLVDFGACMSYKPSHSAFPVTTSLGMRARGMGWLESLMGSDYTYTPEVVGSREGAYTSVSASVMCNFAAM